MRGRFRVGPGDVLLHAHFDAHLDRFFSQATEILNLTISPKLRLSHWAGHVSDADAIMRVAERDLKAASARLFEQFVVKTNCQGDWPDQLAAVLQDNPDQRLDEWAETLGLAPETLSRGFSKLYGVTPAAFRAEARAGHALEFLRRGDGSLASVAAAAGFADQPHMTRAIKSLTGAAPGEWKRKSNLFKTDPD